MFSALLMAVDFIEIKWKTAKKNPTHRGFIRDK